MMGVASGGCGLTVGVAQAMLLLTSTMRSVKCKPMNLWDLEAKGPGAIFT